MIRPSKSVTATRGEAPTDCGLALLARLNVCVNTTQFFSPTNGMSADDVGSDAMNGTPPFHLIVGDRPDSALKCEFEFGPWESRTGTAPTDWKLYLRQAGEYGTAYVNAWLNPNAPGAIMWNMLDINSAGLGALPNYVWGVGDPNFCGGVTGGGIGATFACNVFDLNPSTANANFSQMLGTNYVPPGVPNVLQLGLEQAVYTRNNYLVGGLAIQPYDVRIEAVIYAEEGSFFVLPGNWFNPNSSDVPGQPRDPWVDPQFPYFGQPLDIRIIVDGAVSENIPASPSAM